MDAARLSDSDCGIRRRDHDIEHLRPVSRDNHRTSSQESIQYYTFHLAHYCLNELQISVLVLTLMQIMPP